MNNPAERESERRLVVYTLSSRKGGREGGREEGEREGGRKRRIEGGREEGGVRKSRE